MALKNFEDLLRLVFIDEEYEKLKGATKLQP